MCRILASAIHRPQKEKTKLLLESFSKSAQRDPYLEIISNKKYQSHGDGWGLAYIGYINNIPVIGYYRSIEPIYSEHSRSVIEHLIEKIAELDIVYLVIHARRASRTEPIGQEHSHPFMYRLEKGAIWFAHNGGAFKKDIALTIGEYPWLRTDSELLGLFITKNIQTCMHRDLDQCVVEAYKRSIRYIPSNSALNTCLLVLDEDKPHLYASAWYNTSESNLSRYFSMHKIISEELTALGSITILEYLPRDIREKSSILEPGIYKVDLGECTRLASL